MKIINHFEYSNISAKLVRDATQKHLDNNGQCYAIACLSALWMCRGEEGRNISMKYCSILYQLHILSEMCSKKNIIELINDLCQGVFMPNAGELFHVNQIKKLDPDFSMLKDLPMLAVMHYLYYEPENLPEFSKIVNELPCLDQDFTDVHRILSLIEASDDLILKLKNLFPGYRTIDGQTFKEDFKRIQSSWKGKDGNYATRKIPSIILTREGLEKYCLWIKENVDKYPDNLENKSIQMILTIRTHGITVQYDGKKNKWYIIDSLNLKEKIMCKGIEDITDILFAYLTYNDMSVEFASEIIVEKQFNSDSLNLDEFSKFSGLLHLSLVNNEQVYFFDSEEFKVYVDDGYRYVDEMILAAFSTRQNISAFSLTAHDFYKFIAQQPQIAKKLIDSVFKIPEQVENFIRNIDDIFIICNVYPEFNVRLDDYEKLKQQISIKLIQSYNILLKIIEIFPSMERQLITDSLLPENFRFIFNTKEYLLDFVTKYPLYAGELVERITQSQVYFQNLLMSGSEFICFINQTKKHAEKLVSFALSCPANQHVFDCYASLEDIISICPEYTKQLIVYTLLKQNVTRIFGKFEDLKKFISSYPEYAGQLIEKLLENNISIKKYYPNTLNSIISLAPGYVEKIFNYSMLSEDNFTRIFSKEDLSEFISRHPDLSNQIIDYLSLRKNLYYLYFSIKSISLSTVFCKFPSYAKQLMRLALKKCDDAEVVQLYNQNKDAILQLDYQDISNLFFQFYKNTNDITNIEICVDLLTNPAFKHIFYVENPDLSALSRDYNNQSSQILREDMKEIITNNSQLVIALFKSNENYFDSWSSDDLHKLVNTSSEVSNLLKSNSLIAEKIKNRDPFQNISFDFLVNKIMSYDYNFEIMDAIRILNSEFYLKNSDKVKLLVAYQYCDSFYRVYNPVKTTNNSMIRFSIFNDNGSGSTSCYDYLSKKLHLGDDDLLTCLIYLKKHKQLYGFASNISMQSIDDNIKSLSGRAIRLE